ncbi:MAG: CDP-alcohol phosphatidyltransferase family protein [Haloarculaceae archaeon]
MSGATVAPTGLRRHWAVVAAAFALAFVAVVAGVAAVAERPVAARWAVPAAGVAAFELWFLYRHLDANHGGGPDDRLYGSLGVANAVTLVRGGAFAAVAGFAAVEPTPGLAWLPALLYGGGCALDRIDGYTARRGGRTTVLGARLDMAFDTLGFLVAPVVAVLWGRLPVWYLSLSLARYAFRAGRGLRRRRGRPVHDLPPSSVRRPLAGVQMVFITVALAPVLPAATVRPLAAVVLVPSLAVFARDYLVVSGRFRGRKDND